MSHASAAVQDGDTGQNPELEYRRFLDERKSELAKTVSLDNLNSNIRMVLFLLASGLGLAFIYGDSVSSLWVSIGCLSFLIFVVIHRRIIRETRGEIPLVNGFVIISG